MHSGSASGAVNIAIQMKALGREIERPAEPKQAHPTASNPADRIRNLLRNEREWIFRLPAERPQYGYSVRILHGLSALLALVVTSPLSAVVAVLIKLSSPGPVFFSTEVVGKNRRSFRWYKFRTMRVIPEKQDSKTRRRDFELYVRSKSASVTAATPAKVIDHSRVTWIGQFLRKYSLDELPQLWNILRGEMSFVGPRPCLPYESEFFEGWRAQRFEVTPGLTGMWQVFGRGHVTFDDGAAMDVFYTYRRSLFFDLYLILRTLGVVVTGKGGI
jgi:undecaprenyl-phosphate galactose phosphotransferase